MVPAAFHRPSRVGRTLILLSAGLVPVQALAAGDEVFPEAGIAGLMWPTAAWQWIVGGIIAIAFVCAVTISLLNVVQLANRRFRRGISFLRRAIDNVEQGIVIADEHDRLMFCNERYIQLYKLSPHDVRVGMPIYDLLHLRKSAGTFEKDPNKHTINKGPCRFLRKEPDGRMISVMRRPMPDGGWISTHEDCTEQSALSSELSTTKNFLASVVDNIPLAVAAKEIATGRYILVNNAFLAFSRLSREAIIGSGATDLFTPATAVAVELADQEALDSADGRATREMLVERGSKTRVLAASRVVIKDADGQPEILVTLFDDITEKRALSRELEETKKFLEAIVDNIPIALTVKRITTREFMLVNRRAEAFMGKQRQEIIGRTSRQIFRPEVAKVMEQRDDSAIESGEPITYEAPNKTDDGVRLLLSRRVVISDSNGEPQYLIRTSEDVTERRQTESRMAYMAFHDSLTDLPNRGAFVQALTQMIEANSGEDNEFAVLSVNIDRFKEINDVFGYAYGDRLLVEVSRRLQAACTSAVLARLGGDEFGLIIDGAQPEAGSRLAEDLIASLKDEIVIDGRAMQVGLTAGLAIFPRHGLDATSLLANAAAALFRAKTEARGSALLFEEKMDMQTRERRAMHQELARALRNDELFLLYQPQARAALRWKQGQTHSVPAGQGVVGFEALIRWKHPVRGVVSPSLFIPTAEESGLIAEMGAWVLREACREAASWKKPLQIAVNISPAQFLQGDVASLVHTILLETGLAPGRLELEITEGVLIRDFDRGLSLLRRLKALGVRIAMDDFGTGYSSLSYLQSFPFDKIKIDRTFTMKLGTSPQSAAIVRAVIGLGHGLDVPIVAEGVENAQQMAFLASEGCDEVQGYFIGWPRPIADYADIVGSDAGDPSARELSARRGNRRAG